MYIPRRERGSTLLDAVVGTALMLVVFVGIVGAFRLAVMAVSNNKARAGAIALANERLEYIRSLSYDAIGTTGGIPAGALAQEEEISLNGVEYTRRTLVSYEDDPGDGLEGADSNGVETDYKAIKTSVAWEGRAGTHTITLVTRVSPPGIESAVPGGTLAFNIVDATLDPVANAGVRILNSGIVPAVDLVRYTDSDGLVTVLGVPPGAGYQITVAKSGYSSAQTYGVDATNTNPLPAHLGVALDTTTAATFAIDLLSEKRIETYTPVRAGTTTETFAGDSGIASSTLITVAGGVARLTAPFGDYPPEGTFASITVSTSSLTQWKTFSWESDEPSGTAVAFQIYDGSNVAPIPDSQLPGNSEWFTTSPIDLSGISTSTYGGLVVYGKLTTTDASSTPRVEEWHLSYDSGPHPLPNISFTMTGTKTIGTTAGGAQIYKYAETLSSGANGVLSLENIEWDAYTIVVTDTDYHVASICNPQPETLAPNSTQTTRLYLTPRTANSLLVDVKSGAGAVIPNASVRLFRGAYDVTDTSDTCGNAFFESLSAGSPGSGNPFSIEVSASGYQTHSASDVSVSGSSRLSIILNSL